MIFTVKCLIFCFFFLLILVYKFVQSVFNCFDILVFVNKWGGGGGGGGGGGLSTSFDFRSFNVLTPCFNFFLYERDIKEGADIIMVKPAMFYMDVIKETKLKVLLYFVVLLVALQCNHDYLFIAPLDLIRTPVKFSCINATRINQHCIDLLIFLIETGAHFHVPLAHRIIFLQIVLFLSLSNTIGQPPK